MGSGASALDPSIRDRRLHKEDIDPLLLDRFNFAEKSDSNRTISAGELRTALSDKTDIFVTHCWGDGNANHKRVKKVNGTLRKRGLLTWFDNERLDGDMKDKVRDAIDNARCVVVFITQAYLDKVNGEDADDICRLQFGYSFLKKTASMMIPVVMEPEIRNPSTWTGKAGKVFENVKCVDMCATNISENKIGELYNRIVELTGKPLLTIMDDLIKTIASRPITPQALNAEAVDVGIVQEMSEEAEAHREVIAAWLVDSVSFDRQVADIYAKRLVASSIGSVEKLKKKIKKRGLQVLYDLDFDYTDCKTIYTSLFTVDTGESFTANTDLSPPPNATKCVSIDTMAGVRTLSGHSNSVLSVYQLADGRLASASYDFTVKIWHTATGVLLKSLEGHEGKVVTVMQLADGKLATGATDYNVKLWDSTTFECVKTFSGHADSVICLCQLADGKLASGSSDNNIKVWDLLAGGCIKTFEGHTSTVWSLLELAGGVLVSGSGDKTIKFWNAASDSQPALKTFIGHTNAVMSVIKLRDGNLASGSYDDTIKIWDVETGVLLKTFEGHTRFVLCVLQVAEDKLASCSSDNTIKIWDMPSGECVKTIEAHRDSVHKVIMLSNGKLASCSDDQTIKIWG